MPEYSLPVQFQNCLINQGGASEWRVHSTLIFENLKPVEIKYHLNFMVWPLLILKINTTLEDVYMVLKLSFDISTSFRFSKISVKCTLHSEAPP